MEVLLCVLMLPCGALIVVCGWRGGGVYDEDKIVIRRDASRERIGGQCFETVFFLEELFGAWFAGDGIEGVAGGVFAGGGVVCGDVGVASGDEFVAFGAGEPGGVSGIEDEDGGDFVDARIVGEIGGNKLLNICVVANSGGW